ncbi:MULTISPECIES: BrnA antitoxin family protein [unclassified Shinella]|uniref:BrnA antitoxin family protein n=1 Tax=unclassified Shinella TaxID=2643062 RepID=UPI00225C9203|nr:MULTISPECIES: BrnA antitoxin family protein [unclassified Shinella]MCO5153665.1 BrnA antitoxin family protein [Shinella sp.]MDC7259922.1 BrnA antitoxin family protein [Shinella sp. YE25]CAI0341730.1 conserved hypothetical protein [Rhizobiaceae bacterium]CAK7262046.1 BrnA antitoxin family protein [Shinella sp. WSC3-e]
MTRKWPRFITKDLGDSEADAVEMQRRWQVYDREMKDLVAKGGAHKDKDGWWVETAAGELIGPDPEIERPLDQEDLAAMKPFKAIRPDLYESIQKSRGRPKSSDPKEAVTLRLPRSVLERWKRDPEWRTKMAEALKRAAG